jgi:hypothetical protein
LYRRFDCYQRFALYRRFDCYRRFGFYGRFGFECARRLCGRLIAYHIDRRFRHGERFCGDSSFALHFIENRWFRLEVERGLSGNLFW